MPKIVDKVEKRKDIALCCMDLMEEVGIRKLTIDKVAQSAGIGKGTVYEYFKNKEDIIFEVINIHIDKYLEEFLFAIKDVKTTREKIELFFAFVLDDSEENIKHFNSYKEYLSIILAEDNEDMKNFNNKLNEFFSKLLKDVLHEGIKKGELKKESLDLAEGLLIFDKGLMIFKMAHSNFDANKEFKKFINTIFNFIEIKKDNK